MTMELSQNSAAVLLLCAPLIAGGREPTAGLVTSGEYSRLERLLHERGAQPADLLSEHDGELRSEGGQLLGEDRLRALLARGFQLSQALAHWQARSIWVVSRADGHYPGVLRERLGGEAPVLLFGCGEPGLMEQGGLAIVGSRNVSDALVEYTEGVAELVARAGRAVVSGGARGIDQAAMRGATRAGGTVVGVMADSLERAILQRENRDLLMEGQVVLVSPYDPGAGFNVGHAMGRNKQIYALADAALVVNADFEKGGTWAGATEHLKRPGHGPVYVRITEGPDRALDALKSAGALAWPQLATLDDLERLLTAPVPRPELVRQAALVPLEPSERGVYTTHLATSPRIEAVADPREFESDDSDAEHVETVRELLSPPGFARTGVQIADALGISPKQVEPLLLRLVELGLVERLSKPIRYRTRIVQPSFFNREDDAPPELVIADRL